MKFTLSWLKDHLDTEAPLAEIAEAMTMAGLEVEEVSDPGAALAAFTVARVVAAAQHPNADRLQVCQVETRDGLKEIVCGALNARAGLVTAYAPIGAFIPGTGITLEPKPVRGVVSHGMLCSETELDIGEDPFGLRSRRFEAFAAVRARQLGLSEEKARADGGILELPEDAPVGAALAEALRLEPVIDFEVTPNRPDWLGVEGIARDLAAKGLGRFAQKPIPGIEGRFKSPVNIATEAPEACPVFAARLIRGLKNGPSPAWLQQRLAAIGLKPRNILVDVTNYLSYDRARPLHVYDAAKLTGVVHARLGRAGESFKALDGKTYEVTPEMCVIADARGVLGLGGVMGGEASGASLETTDVLIESAWFDPLRTAQTGRATGITSDARYRFERGVDPGFVLPGLDLAAALILELCGGEASELLLAGEIPAPPAPVAFDPARVARLTGLSLSDQRIQDILAALGFVATAKKGEKLWRVSPPSWRRDVEGPADLVEEVARIEGFEHLPSPQPRAAEGKQPTLSVGESRARLARRALASAGWLEAVTWSFCSRADAALFGGGGESLVLANPIAAELDCMRPTALPHLLRAAQKNADRGFADAKLFEVGSAYLSDAEDGQRRAVAAVWQARPKRSWRPQAPADLFEIKGDCLRALEAVGAPVESLRLAAPEAPWQHPGRGGVLKLGPKSVAWFGEVHPAVLRALDVEGPALAFEIDLDALPAPRAKGSKAKPPLARSELMPLTRDFAFLVDEGVAAGELVRAAFGADKALIADVTLFDVYRGAGVGPGQKSLAIEVTLQPREKTLTDKDIEAFSAKLVGAVLKATGATLRG